MVSCLGHNDDNAEGYHKQMLLLLNISINARLFCEPKLIHQGWQMTAGCTSYGVIIPKLIGVTSLCQ